MNNVDRPNYGPFFQGAQQVQFGEGVEVKEISPGVWRLGGPPLSEEALAQRRTGPSWCSKGPNEIPPDGIPSFARVNTGLQPGPGEVRILSGDPPFRPPHSPSRPYPRHSGEHLQLQERRQGSFSSMPNSFIPSGSSSQAPIHQPQQGFVFEVQKDQGLTLVDTSATLVKESDTKDDAGPAETKSDRGEGSGYMKDLAGLSFESAAAPSREG